MDINLIHLTNDSELQTVLSNCSLFDGLSSEAFAAAVNAGRIYPISEQEHLFHQGEPADVFYVVLEGHIRLVEVNPEGHQITVSYVGPGGGIGIIVALSQYNYPVSAEVVQEGRVIAWGEGAIRALMIRYPRLALNGMKMIADYFVHLQNRYHELSAERVERRVARALLRLVRQTGRRVEEGILIDLPLSRQDLAEMTGTTLFTVSRILKGWEQLGYVIPERERVTIRRPHELVIIAEDLPANDGDGSSIHIDN